MKIEIYQQAYQRKLAAIPGFDFLQFEMNLTLLARFVEVMAEKKELRGKYPSLSGLDDRWFSGLHMTMHILNLNMGNGFVFDPALNLEQQREAMPRIAEYSHSFMCRTARWLSEVSMLLTNTETIADAEDELWVMNPDMKIVMEELLHREKAARWHFVTGRDEVVQMLSSLNSAEDVLARMKDLRKVAELVAPVFAQMLAWIKAHPQRPEDLITRTRVQQFGEDIEVVFTPGNL